MKIAKIKSRNKLIIALFLGFSLFSCRATENIQSVNITNQVEIPKPPVKVEAVKVFPRSSSLNIGEKANIVATVNLTDGTTQNEILWVSSNSSIVRVEQNGEITALKEGFAIVSAVSKKDADKVSEISVLVNPAGTKETEKQLPPTIVSSVVISPASASLRTNESVNLTATVYSSNGSTSNDKVIWKSSNNNIAIVDNTGKVFAINEGQVKIEAISIEDNKKSTESTILIVKNSQAAGALQSVSPFPMITVTPYPTPTQTSTPLPIIIPTPPSTPTSDTTVVTTTPTPTPPISTEPSIPTPTPATTSSLALTSNYPIDTKIVFTGAGKIFTMTQNTGNIKELTDGRYPVWSNDGTKIAFSSNSEIFTMQANGTGLTQLTSNSYIDDLASWSPDGSKIAFASSRDGNFELYLMDADGKNQTRITNSPETDFYPTWSPNGSKIAFSSNGSIYTINPDGSGKTLLTKGSPYTSWSPDSSKIAFTKDNNIYVMNADGTSIVQLTNTTSDYYPSWSPDGSKIAFASNIEGNMKLYIINADGKNLIKITNSSNFDYHPNWSRK